jgi:hypothetical protein
VRMGGAGGHDYDCGDGPYRGGGGNCHEGPAGPEDTRCRPSHAGQLALDAEAGRLAPVPAGLINGTAYGGGTQPPLEPFRVLAALRRLLEDRQVADTEVLRIVGPPYPVTGCELTGDLDALIKGRQAVIRETGRITITGVPVPGPAADAAAPPDRRGWTGYEVSSRPSRPAHLIIESLPARTSPLDAYQAITKQAGSHGWIGSGPERAERPALPVAEIDDQSRRNQVRIGLVLKPGSDSATGGYRQVLRDTAFIHLAVTNVAMIAVGWGVFTWLLPPYAHNQTGIDAPLIGLLLLANATTVVIAQVPVARLAEGRRRVVLITLAAMLFAAACLLVAAAPRGTGRAYPELIAASIAVGIGECLHTTALMPLVADLAPASLRGRYMASMGFSWWIGLAIAPTLGTQLLSAASAATFIAAAGVAAVAAASALALEPRLPSAVRFTPRPGGPAPPRKPAQSEPAQGKAPTLRSKEHE